MTSTQRPINVTVQTATPHAPAAGGRVFVLVTVSGQGQQSETNRRPLNLALVLDRSGSMEGDKLALVKNAALHLIHQLDVRDRVALVTYDQDVEVRVPSTPVAPAMLPTMSMALAAIASGGSTNLEGGWHAGVQAVAQQMGAMPGALHPRAVAHRRTGERRHHRTRRTRIARPGGGTTWRRHEHVWRWHGL